MLTQRNEASGQGQGFLYGGTHYGIISSLKLSGASLPNLLLEQGENISLHIEL